MAHVARTLFSACLLSFLVAQTTLSVLTLKYCFREGGVQFVSSEVILASETVKLCVCACTISMSGGQHTLLHLFKDMRRQRWLAVPPALYIAQTHLLFHGARYLSAVGFIICTQMKVCTTAIFSKLVLKTKLSTRQSLALMLLTCGVVLVQMPNDTLDHLGNKRSDPYVTLINVLLVLLATCMSGMASVLLESIFKDSDVCVGPQDARAKQTIWTINLQLSTLSILMTHIVYIVEERQVLSLQRVMRYDHALWALILLQAIGGITVAFVMKYAGSILKCFATSISTCICAIFSVWAGQEVQTSTLNLGITLVNVAVFMYVS